MGAGRVWIGLRLIIAAGLLVGGNLVNALSLVPAKWPSWAVPAIASGIVFFFLVASEWRREHDHLFAPEAHVNDIRGHSAALARLVAAGSAAFDPTALPIQTRILGLHFSEVDHGILQWNGILREIWAADAEMNDRINATVQKLTESGIPDASGLPALLRNAANGSIVPHRIAWEWGDGPTLYANDRGLLLIGLPLSPDDDARQTWEENVKAAVDEAATLRSKRVDAEIRLSAMRATFLESLEVVASQPEIRRNQKCPICGRQRKWYDGDHWLRRGYQYLVRASEARHMPGSDRAVVVSRS